MTDFRVNPERTSFLTVDNSRPKRASSELTSSPISKPLDISESNQEIINKTEVAINSLFGVDIDDLSKLRTPAQLKALSKNFEDPEGKFVSVHLALADLKELSTFLKNNQLQEPLKTNVNESLDKIIDYAISNSAPSLPCLPCTYYDYMDRVDPIARDVSNVTHPAYHVPEKAFKRFMTELSSEIIKKVKLSDGTIQSNNYYANLMQNLSSVRISSNGSLRSLKGIVIGGLPDTAHYSYGYKGFDFFNLFGAKRKDELVCFPYRFTRAKSNKFAGDISKALSPTYQLWEEGLVLANENELKEGYTLENQYDVVCFECLSQAAYNKNTTALLNVYKMLKPHGVFISHESPIKDAILNSLQNEHQLILENFIKLGDTNGCYKFA